MGKLPFVGKIFFATLLVIVVVAGIAIWAYIKFGGYEVQSADKFGAPITAILLAYLIHLWLLPADVLRGDDPHDGEDGGGEPSGSDEAKG